MYKPDVQTSVPAEIIHKRKEAKLYHDRSAKTLPQIVIGQPIRVKAHPQQPYSNWERGKVVSTSVAPRSHILEVRGRKYRRNRVHLRDTRPLAPEATRASDTYKTVAEKPEREAPVDSLHVQRYGAQQDVSISFTFPVQNMTRSGRVIKPPGRYKDYVQRHKKDIDIRGFQLLQAFER